MAEPTNEQKWRLEKIRVFSLLAIQAIKHYHIDDAYYFAKWAAHEALELEKQ